VVLTGRARIRAGFLTGPPAGKTMTRHKVERHTMKKTKPVKPTRSDNPGRAANETSVGQVAPQAVRFEYVNGNTRTVQLAGAFNNWRPESMAMTPLSRCKWAKDLSLSPSSYEYRLIVEGQWLADPENRERVPKPFGGRNSVKVVLPVALPPATLRTLDPGSAKPSARANR